VRRYVPARHAVVVVVVVVVLSVLVEVAALEVELQRWWYCICISLGGRHSVQGDHMFTMYHSSTAVCGCVSACAHGNMDV
jgi:hypothetical protein